MIVMLDSTVTGPLLWMILTGVIGFVLIAYLVIVIYCKRKTLCGRKNTEQPPPPSPAHADSGMGFVEP